MDIIHSNNSNSNQQKKIEKNDIIPQYKILKSNEIRETNKNSYFSKYLEENNRTKLNKKNNSLRQSKIKAEQKEITNNNHQNLSLFSNKKSKNNSVDKNLNNNQININQKKYALNLNNEFKNIDNSNNKKSNNIISMTPRYIRQSNNYNNSDNPSEKEINQNLKKINKNGNAQIPEIKNLSQKEKSYLILSYSKCLRLCERMIFARSTSKLRQSISKKDILDTNRIYLNEKLKELENKIENCNDKLKNKFNASKTAEMTLNYITSNIENEFKLNLFQNLYDENDKIYCYNYVKLLYILLDEDYAQIENENLIKQLYQKISNKGYINIKDYLYFIYIKHLKKYKSIENIDKINDILACARFIKF